MKLNFLANVGRANGLSSMCLFEKMFASNGPLTECVIHFIEISDNLHVQNKCLVSIYR